MTTPLPVRGSTDWYVWAQAIHSAATAGYEPTALTEGESTIPRIAANNVSTLTSGTLRLAYMTARKTETITRVRVGNGTAAAATPTLVRVGLYSAAADGSATLLAATANDTTVFNTATSWYTRALNVPVSKVAGQRYAVGLLVVSTATVPNTPAAANSNAVMGAELGLSPRQSGAVAGQTDLPASVAAGTVAVGSSVPYAVLLP